MLVSTKAIVLSKLKYADNDLIVKCYTEKKGIVKYLLKGVLKAKRANIKIAYFQLFSQLNIESNYRENRALQTIKHVRLSYNYSSLHTDLLKASIVMFLAEVLSSILKEEEQNKPLFSYLETTLQWLDTHHEHSNFHLLFLLNLTKQLGFYPDTSNLDCAWFNLHEGKFETNQKGKYSISGKNVNLLKRLLGTTFDALVSIKIKSKQRQSFLNMILLYFELHLGNFKKPKSLQIFNQVFN